MGWFSQLLKKFEQRPPEVSPGKNDLCWCGSGVKYKKCHLVRDRLYFKEHPQKKAFVKKSCSPTVG